MARNQRKMLVGEEDPHLIHINLRPVGVGRFALAPGAADDPLRVPGRLRLQ